MSSLHPGLRAAFPEPFARFGETLGPPSADAVPLPDLWGAATLPGVAARYAASFPGNETRAALSLWSQYYLLALVPCATAAALATRCDLPLDPCGMAAILGEDGQPCRLCLPHGGGDTAEACPVRRLAPLLHTHLTPLGHALASAGLSPLIFWSNAAAVLSWSLGVIAAPSADRDAVWAAMAAPCWADGAANPFRRVLGSDPAQRRICCLRFRLQCVGRCLDCPAALGRR